MFLVDRSNRADALFDALADAVSTPPDDPLAPEVIVVGARGVDEWLAARLAERFGVWAGGDFPSPRRFVHDTLSAVLGETPDDAFDAERLIWPILAELPHQLEHRAFAELSRFLLGDTNDARRFQLAQRIARAFDRYVVYRPRTVLGWERGEHDDWQARLWRGVVERCGANHIAASSERFVRRLRAPDFDPSVLPQRVHLFAISGLPPLYLELLVAMSRHRPVRLWNVRPSLHYVGDLDVPSHPLLASLGELARDFDRVLESGVEYQESSRHRYVAPASPDGSLGRLQASMLELGAPPSAPLAQRDDTLDIHSCHSPMREVEVLHDRLLAVLDDDTGPSPEDIVVFMTDVDTYAPLVEAVFERASDDPSAIPYRIAERAEHRTSQVHEALVQMLRLVEARIGPEDIIDLLALEPVAHSLGISAAELEQLARWIRDSGIRWGIDANDRVRHGQPEFDENTWRFGFARLLLGYAMPMHDRATYAGVLPYDEIEGQEARLLGRFVERCELLFAALASLAEPRDMRGWQVDLARFAERMLGSDVGVPTELGAVREALEALAAEAETGGFDGVVPLDTVRGLLEDRLNETRPQAGFEGGGVTFCSIHALRGVPFDVVCVLGLGEGQFPRADPILGFDLMRRAPKPADPSRRAEDRFSFLMALLAARKRVLLFYVGQSIQDNTRLQPSVVVGQLLDELERLTGREASERVLQHPMQPFSPRYFDTTTGDRLFTYRRHFLEGAAAIAQPSRRRAERPWFPAPLAPLAPAEDLPLYRFLRFFRQPAAELVRRRLGVDWSRWEDEVSEREPIELSGLATWRIGDTMLRRRLAMPDLTDDYEQLRAQGVLPLGAAGRTEYERMLRLVEPLVHCARADRRGAPLPRLPIDLRVGDVRLQGALDDRWPAGMVRARFSRVSAAHLLQEWIRHLVLCQQRPGDQELRTTLLFRPDDEGDVPRLWFRPVTRAADRLEHLVSLYLEGQTEPLRLFPRTSWAYSDTLARTGDVTAALQAARREWTGSGRTGTPPGERDDPHLRRLFGPSDGGDSTAEDVLSGTTEISFAHLAREVFDPLRSHLEGLK